MTETKHTKVLILDDSSIEIDFSPFSSEKATVNGILGLCYNFLILFLCRSRSIDSLLLKRMYTEIHLTVSDGGSLPNGQEMPAEADHLKSKGSKDLQFPVGICRIRFE
ncbi:hypothetical protein [Sporolactobacillus putidus]|uniref:Uncharacterized protein n=1 Tax=Sporolactobacillus putidus TaxID=492735 RepID=A0A917W362_9BACL|nr:hypothetical protein [Sporolactobacillus putidus]GGL58274.1 hypothetical protein GCM10007968_22840 [Sporolactobacillus putidus]